MKLSAPQVAFRIEAASHFTVVRDSLPVASSRNSIDDSIVAPNAETCILDLQPLREWTLSKETPFPLAEAESTHSYLFYTRKLHPLIL